MAGTPGDRWERIRGLLARRDDAYAGADLQSAQRLVPMLGLLSALLAVAFLPMAHPSEQIGGAGWAVAGVSIVAQAAGAIWLLRSPRAAGFNALLAFAYGGVASVALLEWLAGGHSPYMLLYLLWVGAGAGVHPPRRTIPFLATVIVAGALPLLYGGKGPNAARDIAATSMLWLAIGAVILLLISNVRRQRVILRSGERSAREEADEAERRVRAVEQVIDVTLAQLPLDDLLDELLARTDAMLDLDGAAILLLDDQEEMLLARATHGIAAASANGPIRIPVGSGCAGRVAAEGRQLVLDSIDDTGDLDPLFRDTAVRALVGLPLRIGGRLIGVLEVASREERRFSGDDVRLLELAADRLGQVIERTRINERAHEIAGTLQRALLPDQLPQIPGVGLAARYLPGGADAEVGGDWYDVVPYPDGRVALVMGDVVGRGIAAAALMGQLRNGLRVYSLEHDDPAEILNRMNVLLHQLEPDQMSTAVVVIFDPSSGRLCFSSAGHPPPLVLAPDGAASYLDSTPSLPLGIHPYGVYHSHEGTLGAGATLLLYTDGLVERRDSPLRAGLNHLRAVANSGPSDAEELCEHVVRMLLPRGASGDDVALLTMRHEPVTGPRLRLEVPADPDELALIRRSMERWLATSDVDERDAYRVTLAANEACMNAIEHGFGGTSADFELDAELSGSEVAVVVRDRGRWRPPRRPGDGRGLSMMRALMDDVEVSTGPGGTTVRLRRAVRRTPF